MEKEELLAIKTENNLETKRKSKRDIKAKEKAQRKEIHDIKKIEELEDDSIEHFYRLNLEKFIHQNRTLELSMLVKEKLGADAGMLLKIMLDNSDRFESVYKNPLSSSFSLNKLLDLTKNSLAMTKSTLREFVENLTKEEFRCLDRKSVV